MYGSRLFIYKNATLSEFDKVALTEFNIKKKCRPVRVLLNTRCDLSYLTNAFEEVIKNFQSNRIKIWTCRHCAVCSVFIALPGVPGRLLSEHCLRCALPLRRHSGKNQRNQRIKELIIGGHSARYSRSFCRCSTCSHCY